GFVFDTNLTIAGLVSDAAFHFEIEQFSFVENTDPLTFLIPNFVARASVDQLGITGLGSGSSVLSVDNFLLEVTKNTGGLQLRLNGKVNLLGAQFGAGGYFQFNSEGIYGNVALAANGPAALAGAGFAFEGSLALQLNTTSQAVSVPGFLVVPQTGDVIPDQTVTLAPNTSRLFAGGQLRLLDALTGATLLHLRGAFTWAGTANGLAVTADATVQLFDTDVRVQGQAAVILDPANPAENGVVFNVNLDANDFSVGSLVISGNLEMILNSTSVTRTGLNGRMIPAHSFLVLITNAQVNAFDVFSATGSLSVGYHNGLLEIQVPEGAGGLALQFLGLNLALSGFIRSNGEFLLRAAGEIDAYLDAARTTGLAGGFSLVFADTGFSGTVWGRGRVLGSDFGSAEGTIFIEAYQLKLRMNVTVLGVTNTGTIVLGAAGSATDDTHKDYVPKIKLTEAPTTGVEGSSSVALAEVTIPNGVPGGTTSMTWSVTKNEQPWLTSGTTHPTDFTTSGGFVFDRVRLAYAPDDNGVFVATLNVVSKDANGAPIGTASKTLVTYVANAAPYQPLGIIRPLRSTQFYPVTMTAEPGGDPAGPNDTFTHHWRIYENGAIFNFPGVPEQVTHGALVASGAGDAFVFNPAGFGTYLIELYATDEDGGTGPSLFRTIIIDALAMEDPTRITVTDTGNAISPSDGLMTLPEAVMIANVAVGAQEIVFAPSLAGQTIRLNRVADDSFGPAALHIVSELILDGFVGVVIATDDNAAPMRLFTVAPGASLTLNNITLSGGVAVGSAALEGRGGVVYNRGALRIDGATLLNNRARGDSTGASGAAKGGGVFNDFTGTVNIVNSTFSGNTAAGGVAFGGALYNRGGAVTITNSTFADNQVTGGLADGAAIYNKNEGGIGALSLRNTLLANNLGAADAANHDGALSGSHNLIRNGSGTFAALPSTITADPLLGPLQNNGGPTATYAIGLNSPALNAGASNGAPAFDQRGIPRDSRRDIGAFEFPRSAHPHGPYAIDEGGSIVLDASDSADVSSITRYEWDLNYDGQTFDADLTATQPASSLSLPQSFATRVIALRVSDAAGYRDLATTTLTVRDVPPTLALSGAATTDEGSEYVLSLSSSDLGADIIDRWTIHWGDGSVQTVAGNPSSVTHVYADGPAQFTITASATDGEGTYSAPDSVSVQVLNVPPTIVLSGDPVAYAGVPYTLNISVIDPGADTISHFNVYWGAWIDTLSLPGNPASVTHVFTVVEADQAANGKVTITVRSSDEGAPRLNTAGDYVATFSLEVKIPAPSASIVPAPALVFVGQELTFQGTITAPAGDLYWSIWKLYDGGQDIGTKLDQVGAVTSFSSTFVFTPQHEGYFDLTLGTNRNFGLAHVRLFAWNPTFVVNSAGDVFDPADNVTTLREAITMANLWPGAQTITFAPTLAGQTISLASVADSSLGPSALAIDTEIIIDASAAPGLTITRAAAAPEMRLFQVSPAGDLTLKHLTLTNGLARGDAAGTADGLGGAILNQGKLTLDGVTIAGSSAWAAGTGRGRGGAIFNAPAATASITNSTLSSNSADAGAAGQGGAIYNHNGHLTILNSTIALSSASPGGGGGIYQLQDGAGIATLSLTNTIVARSGTAKDIVNVGGSASGSNNLVGTHLGVPAAVVSMSADPKLRPLQNNGGPTPTHSLDADSPALDAALAGAAPQTDQRGHGRGAAPDLGAYELDSPVAPWNSPEGSPLVLDASLWTSNADATQYEWDFDFNGSTFNSWVTTTNPRVTWTFADDFAARAFALRVTRGSAGADLMASTLQVSNVPPTLLIDGKNLVLVGRVYELALTASDPGADTIDHWTINWGDGSPVQTVSGNSHSVTHVYTAAASVTISASATDEDGTFQANSLAVEAQQAVLAVSLSS
ncbi:MAG: choice-of-anchor Q domain-containing protein, partial [Verrucomicrobiota bacterium]